MQTFVVRVWVPDRPGALGQVASRIGAVRGDVVGIDILERGAGRAIDELVVELPDAGLVSLLLAEIDQVDGVDVEDVRPAPAELADPRLDALETAAVLVGAASKPELLASLVAHARRDFGAEWAVVVDLDERILLSSHGTPPPPGWLVAFVAGSQSSAAVCSGECGPDDVAWTALAGSSLALLLGRQGRPFRSRERHQLLALAKIAQHVLKTLDRIPEPVAAASP
ncbi:MAG TPA: ACT domain-containing protein [Acidimicrobiales bacterium]|nr:ACT domain-containing protein [Acidimicrobiales bacterium]